MASNTRLVVPAPITIPSASSASDAQSTAMDEPCLSPRLVRFDERCVLIPESPAKSPRQQPRIGTLDVPIPFGLSWRWPGASSAKDKELGGQGDEPEDVESLKSNVVLKVPFPIFRRKSHSSVQTSASCTLPPCLVQRDYSSTASPSLHPSSASSSSAKSPRAQVSAQARSRPTRSASLPPYPQSLKIETVPLRSCCAQCLSACEAGIHLLPSLKESSQEQNKVAFPARQVRSNSRESSVLVTKGGEEEDWCAGFRFTRGALKLRRSASVERGSHDEREGANLLGALVRVDEVDLKRGTSPASSPPVSLRGGKTGHGALNKPDLDRLKVRKGTGCPTDDSEEDLFPLPSPKRSPGASPADSATCLPTLVTPAEPRKLEAAIKAKMATRERDRELEQAKVSATAPIPIPGAQARAAAVAPSRYQSRTDEIVYDPSLPDPDALPAGSTILLNSPPGSPPLSPHSPPPLSSSPQMLPSVHDFESLSLSSSIAAAAPAATGTAAMSGSPSSPNAARRRPSLTKIMRAGAGVLRGISIGAPATQSASSPGYTSYSGRMVV
ncbi:hypothetical protein M0805_004999 [Coniferiporia weirii]|nr:hypothetical protein M0805_004999 [Coniferiporia weirii]